MMKLIVCVIVGISLVSCQLTAPFPTRPPVVNHGILTDTNCIHACWRGLVPGQTPLEAVPEQFLAPGEELLSADRGMKYDKYGFISGMSSFGYGEYIRSEDGIISQIDLGANQSFDLDLQSILGSLGFPSHTLLSYMFETNRSYISGHFVIYYPNEGYIFRNSYLPTVKKENGIEICIDPTLTFSGITMTSPRDISELIRFLDRPIFNLNEERAEILESSLKPWPGFGCYTLQYPPQTYVTAQYW